MHHCGGHVGSINAIINYHDNEEVLCDCYMGAQEFQGYWKIVEEQNKSQKMRIYVHTMQATPQSLYKQRLDHVNPTNSCW